jgi:2-oxoglutarate dehydrogenase E2 component (dihydrolipoamide succinyltransferase)
MANKTFNVPNMGDSITEGTVFELLKKQGDFVDMDEVIALVETDKVQVELKAEQAGNLVTLFAEEGQNIEVGKPFVEIDIDAKGQSTSQPTSNTSQPTSQPTNNTSQPTSQPPKAKEETVVKQ